MKLPNGYNAYIDERKLSEYCLSPMHQVGKHKSRLFFAAVGMTLEHVESLVRQLKTAAAEKDAEIGKHDAHGQRYTIDFEAVGPTDTALLRSAWIIKTGEDFPRLTTCYLV